MSRFLPDEVFELVTEPRERERRDRGAWLLFLRGWLFVGMGLTGILTVALIVTADRSYAGIDGVRAARALVPSQVDTPAVTRIPFLGGIISAIHDAAPLFFGPSPNAVTLPTPAPGPASPRPANSPSAFVDPKGSGVPAVQLPGAATPSPVFGPSGPSASPNASAPVAGPSATLDPNGTPAPSATPAPTATPSPTPASVLSISTDRGGTAIVNLTGLLPGDSMDRSITVQNDGTLGFTYTVKATHSASTLLWTDTIDGLQLTVSTSGGAVLYSGPLSGLGSLAGPTTLAPSASELLRYTFDFPATAPNTFQGLVQDLTLVFDAIQFP